MQQATPCLPWTGHFVGAGILTSFPFAYQPKLVDLGLTNACSIAVDRQTFSTTAIKR